MSDEQLDLCVCTNASQLYQRAAERFVATAKKVITARNMFHVALSGGSTPRSLFQQLSSEYPAALEWSRVRFYWSDERTVPADHDDSNYKMARETLLDPLSINPAHVHRLRGEDNPATAAAEYERMLRAEVPTTLGDVPRLDLVLLGIGADGHTASIFPHTSAVNETARLVVANHVPQQATWRLTMTAPLINAAFHVMFLATGQNKAAAVAGIIEGPVRCNELPAQLICPTPGTFSWYLDESAASQLGERRT
jgi:6-phosphogluconolactonase